MSVSNERFISALKSVPDCYDYFVRGMTCAVKTEEDRQEIVDYISRNPKATTSDVIKYYTENLMGEDDEDEDDEDEE